MRHLYVILGVAGPAPKTLGEKVNGLRAKFGDCKIRPLPGKRAWLLCCDESIKTVTKHLHMNNEKKVTGIVVKAQTYYGYAPNDFWDWLRANWS